MGKKTTNELEETLRKLHAREARLREELAAQKRAADAKAQKIRTRKMCELAEQIMEITGEGVLDQPELLVFFLADHSQEIRPLYFAVQNQVADDNMTLENTGNEDLGYME